MVLVVAVVLLLLALLPPVSMLQDAGKDTTGEPAGVGGGAGFLQLVARWSTFM